MTITPHSQAWLTDSWSRSQGAGLQQTSSPDALRLDRDALAVKHFQHKQLIELVKQHALPLFNQLMAHSKSRLILSDSEGYVLCHWGVSQYSDKLANVALDIGVNWQEQHKGTNAIGTALLAKQAVSVIGDQHFIRQHRFMSCTASPIFSPQGELIGAIDITSEQQRHTQQTLLLISSLVQQVETALLCHLPGSHYRIDLAEQPSLMTSGWQGIVVANADGKILGCNPMAKTLLHDAKVGDDLHQYLGEKWNRSEHLLQHQRFHLKTQSLVPERPTQVVSQQVGVRFRDPTLARAWQQANKVVRRCIPLLICGETGVGKEQFVKKLHAQSGRSQGPLVAVNCAALPAELVESELFGYQAGAFTGAHRNGYEGKIRQADGGFLFLDEIGEMPMATQSRLLRVLQEREVVPVGSNRSYKVDIQVVAATHANLQALVKAGEFRDDLYYRLNGLQVMLPALRQRSDRERIIHKLHRRYRTAPQTICPQLLRCLLDYAWPGNLRELDNLMQVACLMAEDEVQLQWQHLPDALQTQLGGQAQPEMSATTAEGELSLMINANIVATFHRFDGNVSRCAKYLGMSRNTLYRKLKVLGLKSA
ncbi:sigma-54-dependent Fis family transcriptional regulator [Shewanella colwelliana]|uniref:sigma-54-dependent Fis family transcriptional regulator n=1 Tax=Shewanella colwelliana TaxID=23 RepID=UPI0022AF9D52|nr:sigma-54-dependent Fis family transcriptional regulator [Shewanella colwelliana]MCZ4338006.1 sigma-54-dependent Fis family transcriptional regulator [Shewanella colwelliana]